MIAYYQDCLKDSRRIDLYRQAIRQAVMPGDTVLELGCGLGTYSMFAAQAGAKKVYAIDPSPIIYTAMDVARKNGFGETISFSRVKSEDFLIPEKVDWIITEFFGASAADLLITSTLDDATKRFLKPGGRVLPQHVRMYVAPIEGGAIYRDCVTSMCTRVFDLDFSQAGQMMMNYPHHISLHDSRTLGTPSVFAETLLPAHLPRALHSEHQFSFKKKGIVHGFGLWFDLELVDGIHLSTAPNSPPLAWHQLFLPLAEPIPIYAGSTMVLNLSATSSPDDEIWWRWEGQRLSDSSGSPALSFSHNSFQSVPFPPLGVDRISYAAPEHLKKTTLV